MTLILTHVWLGLTIQAEHKLNNSIHIVGLQDKNLFIPHQVYLILSLSITSTNSDLYISFIINSKITIYLLVNYIIFCKYHTIEFSKNIFIFCFVKSTSYGLTGHRQCACFSACSYSDECYWSIRNCVFVDF